MKILMRFKLCFGLILLILVGCTTTTTGGGDPERALENYIQLGRNYLSEGERERARFNLLKALEIDEDSPDANNVLALLYETEGEIEEAKRLYHRAIAEDRNYSPARMNYARVLYSEGEYRDSRNQYQTVTEDINYRLRADAFLGMGLSELRLGNVEEAKTALNRTLLLNPNIGPALLEVTQIAYEQREYALALEYLERYEQTTLETPRSLMLGVQLSRIFQESDKEKGYAFTLQNMFPNSTEARELSLGR